jgi:hypothetical protein
VAAQTLAAHYKLTLAADYKLNDYELPLKNLSFQELIDCCCPNEDIVYRHTCNVLLSISS